MMMPISRDEVLSVVRNRGPIIPNEIKKVLKQGDTMLLGAMLSELASKGHVKISRTKIGGSPFYYDPTKPESLERIAEHLNEKDGRTYHLLKEKKVLRDSNQEALIRVSLRNIHDFSRQLNVGTAEGEIIFWKYYLVSDEEAENLIRKQLTAVQPKEIETVPPPPPQMPPAERQVEPLQEVAPKETKPEQKPETTVPKTEPKQEEKPAPKKEEPKQEHLAVGEIDDEFYKEVKAFLDKSNITIKEQKLIRKNSEIDLIILMPTPVGDVEYFCKAKAKKKSNDGDLASAKLEGQGKNLPVLYLTTGEITKKAKDLLSTSFKGLVVKELK